MENKILFKAFFLVIVRLQALGCYAVRFHTNYCTDTNFNKTNCDCLS